VRRNHPYRIRQQINTTIEEEKETTTTTKEKKGKKETYKYCIDRGTKGANSAE